MRKKIIIISSIFVILLIAGAAGGYYLYNEKNEKIIENYKNTATDIIDSVKNNQIALVAPVGKQDQLSTEQFFNNIPTAIVGLDYTKAIASIDSLISDTDDKIATLKSTNVPAKYKDANETYIKALNDYNENLKEVRTFYSDGRNNLSLDTLKNASSSWGDMLYASGQMDKGDDEDNELNSIWININSATNQFSTILTKIN